MCLKPTDSSTPSALPELSLPVSSPSDLGTVMEVTMFSAPPSPPSGTRIEEGNYIYIYIERYGGFKKITHSFVFFPKRPQRYTKCLLETLVLPISQL